MSISLSHWTEIYSQETTLSSFKCILIDVQSTGASPKSGALLELAYMSLSEQNGMDQGEVISLDRLVMLPPGVKIPRRVSQLTGIKNTMLKSAMKPEVIANQLWTVIYDVCERIDRREGWAWLAHVARYEYAFIRALCLAHRPPEQLAKEAEELFDRIPWICTHAICVRLYPTLPRRTLSAMNSVFGGDSHALKRASHHLQSTSTIWRGVLIDLDKRNIKTWGKLCDLIKKPAKRQKFAPPMSPQKRLSAPSLPGVYTFYDDRDDPVYVGMARNLHQRVNQHFRGRRGHDERHLELLTVTRNASWVVKRSTLEARHLESRDIKRLKPKYNQAMTSTKAPFYVDPVSWNRDLATNCTDSQLMLGPWIDEALFDLLGVFRSAQRGDFSKIHHHHWSRSDVATWRKEVKLVEESLDRSTNIDQYIQGLFPQPWESNDLRAWLHLGYQLSKREYRNDNDPLIVGQAKGLAQKLWQSWVEGQWQGLFTHGMMIWSADEGGEGRTWRSLRLEASSSSDSVYISTLPSTENEIGDLSDFLPHLRQPMFLDRITFDETRLTYLTVMRQLREGTAIYYRSELLSDFWYQLKIHHQINLSETDDD